MREHNDPTDRFCFVSMTQVDPNMIQNIIKLPDFDGT